MIKKLNIGIDCFNISSGGGYTHLKALLSEFDLIVGNKFNVIIWGSKSLLNKLPTYKWLNKQNISLLNKNLLLRFIWHLLFLKKETIKFDIDVLISPGGISLRTHVPNINMFRNVLPFLNEEIKRYNLLKRFRFLVFRLLSIYSFKNCNGIIFLSKWSKSFLLSKVGKIKGYSKVIPHGVYPKKKLIAEKELDFKNKIKILYVSHTSPYKNYDYVIKNLILFCSNNSLYIDFISVGDICEGFNYKYWTKKTPPNLNLKFLGQVNHSKTLDYIRNANICVFASSAENFPNVLLEYMSYGSICLCSNKPMKSLLGNAGLFFDLDVENDLLTIIE